MDPRPEQPLQSAEAELPPPADDEATAPLVATSPAGSPGGEASEPGVGAAPEPGLGAGTEPPVGDALAPAVVAASAPRRSGLRWLVAAIVVVAVIGAAVLATMFLGARPLPEALRYMPADSALVVELRPELPGDEREHLGNLLAHFPGFADQSTLDAKIDEALGRLVRQADSAIDYAKQVKPLLAGPLTVSMSAADLAGSGSGKTPAGLLLVATTDGKATCSSISGSPTTAGETHRGVKLEVLATNSEAACALDGRFLLFGTAAAIEHGIDAHADGKGVDGNSTFRSARQRLTGDQVGLLFLNGKIATGSLASLAPSLGIDTSVASAFPEWLVAGLRVVDDAIQVELVTPPVAVASSAPALPSGLPTDPPPAKSHFAAMLPANAFGFVEAHGMGANIQRAIAQLGADPATASSLKQVEDALTSIGGVENLAGWIEDLGIAGVPVGDGAGAIVLIRGTDAAATQGRLDQLRNLLALASVGSDISVRTADHNGVAVTSVDLGDLGPTLESLGAPAGILPSGSHVKFTMAATGGVLLLGVGDGVIEAVLDTDAAHSLAAFDTYGKAIERAGTPNDLEVFLAIDSIAGWLEAHPPAGTDLTDFNANVKPYLDHLAGAVESTVTDGTGTHARIVITVK